MKIEMLKLKLTFDFVFIFFFAVMSIVRIAWSCTILFTSTFELMLFSQYLHRIINNRPS